MKHPSVLPEAVEPYSKSPVYDESSLPAALQNRHMLRSGTWARLHVVEGAIRFAYLEPEVQTLEVAQGDPHIVPPEVPHRVELMGRVRLYLEFYR